MVSDRNIRVLDVTASYPTPGRHLGAFLQREVEGLRKIGVDVDVLHLQGRMKYVEGAQKVFWASLRNRYDIIHGHYSFCGAVAVAQFRVPTVITFWGSDVLKDPLLPDTAEARFSRRISPWLARRANASIVPIQSMADQLHAPNVHVVAQGIDFNLFTPIPQAEARRQLGLNEDPNHRYVLFCANPEIVRKGFAVARAAVDLMRQYDPAIELIVANGVPHEQVITYMNACDVLTLPSSLESGPFTVKEAMAVNLPIVSTDVGDVAQVIGKTAGCYIAERTPEDFATKMWQSLHEVRRTTGRQDMAHLSRERQVNQIYSIYQEVLRGSSVLRSASQKA